MPHQGHHFFLGPKSNGKCPPFYSPNIITIKQGIDGISFLFTPNTVFYYFFHSSNHFHYGSRYLPDTNLPFPSVVSYQSLGHFPKLSEDSDSCLKSNLRSMQITYTGLEGSLTNSNPIIFMDLYLYSTISLPYP